MGKSHHENPMMALTMAIPLVPLYTSIPKIRKLRRRGVKRI
jgi:hypothetical protein